MKKLFLALLCSKLFSVQIGDIISIHERNNEFYISSSDGAITKVVFYREDIFRIWVAPKGNFTDPAGSEETSIVVHNGDPIKINISEESDYYKLESKACVLRIYKNPCTFSLYKKDNNTLIFEEIKPITYGKESYQTIQRNKDDYFYGCGMQNGHFCHNDRSIQIENIYDDKQNIWNEDGTPNAASFYMSLKGYGVFRNTYEGGLYEFLATVKTTHKENRFDAYYFAGDLKEILEGYTYITGRPFLTPLWGLEFGDADRYNDGSFESVKFADEYIDKQIPLGWILPNDGYGMDFSKVPEVSKEMTKRGIVTGMWTDKKLDFEKYVIDHNVRLFKLDIAWVGRGTKFSMNASRKVYNYIENNSDERGLIWTTLGWAGNHRYSIMWTGDNGYQNPDDWIRWHIPTMIGSGLSAQNAATGDIDGIYGGNADRYVRDLQWKTFTTNMMIIDNWKVSGEEWKKPWSYGEPFTSYNRESLKLKSRLMPYLYTYSHESYNTGLPVTRACVLEFPEDPKTREETGENGLTKYQFMCGEWFLVAPVYKNQSVKEWSLYLPKGKWTDFFTGKQYDGDRLLNGYDVSDYKMPVFVREGGIIPMYPESYYDRDRTQQKPRNPLTLDIYPSDKKITRFELIEDDGLTYQFKTDSMYNKTLIESHPNLALDKVIIKINGNYEGRGYVGMPETRDYLLQIHGGKPQSVSLKNKKELNKKIDDWYFDVEKNILHIKIEKQESINAFSIQVFY
jgi:alpha-glucosidase (family GH31 glycosyl hydrolase)